MITRRTAVKRMGAAAGAAALLPRLTGCGGGDEDAGITHLVCLCMENRSYDHFLGARKLLDGLGGDGLMAGMRNDNLAGETIDIYRETTCRVPDPPHDWSGSRTAWNDGMNDGFVRAYQEDQGEDVSPFVMGYLTRAELPVSWALADSFASCDRWFASLMGPTWPNRMYLHSAQSGGLSTNDFGPQNGFDWPSIYGRLDAGGVPWKYYFSNLPFAPLFTDVTDVESRVERIEQFFRDCANGRLAPFSMLDPSFFMNDDHPPTHPALGQQLISSVYAALAASPHWNNVLLVVTYDEHGGFFDHVSPPTAADERAAEGFDQLGFRVPTLIAGPYVKPGYVSSVTFDHTSVLKHAETMFGLEPLTARDAAANDLSDVIDLGRLERREPLAPAVIPSVIVDENMITDACEIARKRWPEIHRLFPEGRIPRGFDHRDDVGATLRTVARAARRLGVGGIR